MPARVAQIPNLECEAFYYDMERRGIQFVRLEANAVAAALRAGEIDAGPVPLVDIPLLEDRAAPVHGFCVASVTTSAFSLLYSRDPIESSGNLRIAVGSADSASVALLRVLLVQKHGVRFEAFVGEEEEHEAVLLTGNSALRRRRGNRGYPHRYDLGEEWNSWTGLPFVFSRWMMSRDMERQDRVVLEDALFVGQEDWINNLYKATGPRDDLFMLPREVLEYVQGLRFFIGVPEERSMTLFREKLALLKD